VSHNCDGPLGEHNALVAYLIGIELPDIAVPPAQVLHSVFVAGPGAHRHEVSDHLSLPTWSAGGQRLLELVGRVPLG
jgi:hypothetical protein